MPNQNKNTERLYDPNEFPEGLYAGSWRGNVLGFPKKRFEDQVPYIREDIVEEMIKKNQNRWRVLGDEKPEIDDKNRYYQLLQSRVIDGKQEFYFNNIFRYCNGCWMSTTDHFEISTSDLLRRYFTHWRPLPTDLPEEVPNAEAK